MLDRFQLLYTGELFDNESGKRYTTVEELYPLINEINDRLDEYDYRLERLREFEYRPSIAIQHRQAST